MSNSLQTFFGECSNDDSKYGIFMTKVTGTCNGRKIAWEQLIPTQWSYDVSTLFFKGYLSYFKDVINGGRIYTLTGKKKEARCQGRFSARRLVYDLEEMPPELPAGIVAAMIQCGCMWYWSLGAMMNGGESLTCWSFVPRCCDGDDTQAMSDKDKERTEEVVKLKLKDASL